MTAAEKLLAQLRQSLAESQQAHEMAEDSLASALEAAQQALATVQQERDEARDLNNELRKQRYARPGDHARADRAEAQVAVLTARVRALEAALTWALNYVERELRQLHVLPSEPFETCVSPQCMKYREVAALTTTRRHPG
jgi:hypothetical protein